MTWVSAIACSSILVGSIISTREFSCSCMAKNEYLFNISLFQITDVEIARVIRTRKVFDFFFSCFHDVPISSSFEI